MLVAEFKKVLQKTLPYFRSQLLLVIRFFQLKSSYVLQTYQKFFLSSQYYCRENLKHSSLYQILYPKDRCNHLTSVDRTYTLILPLQKLLPSVSQV